MHQLRSFSREVGTEAVEVHPSFVPLASAGTAECTGGLTHLNVQNTSHTGGPVIWLSRSGTAAPGKPGSYPLAPGEREEYEGGSIPLEALSAAAEADGAALTCELRHLPRIFRLGEG